MEKNNGKKIQLHLKKMYNKQYKAYAAHASSIFNQSEKMTQ